MQTFESAVGAELRDIAHEEIEKLKEDLTQLALSGELADIRLLAGRIHGLREVPDLVTEAEDRINKHQR